MKKIIWPIMLGMTLLIGCQNSESKTQEVTKQASEGKKQDKAASEKTSTTFVYPNLLSESADSYSLLAIGEQDEKNPIEKNKKITVNVNDILSLPTLEMAQKAYPDLNIENVPSYMLFDQNGMVLQTKDIKRLTSYLGKNKPK
jgi:hypothetical protein